MTPYESSTLRAPSTGWGVRAACSVSGVESTVFDLGTGGQVRLALFLCSVCTVSRECADAARAESADGVIRAGAFWEGGVASLLSEPEHGTRARYKRGCRCLVCRAAEAAYRRELRAAAGVSPPRPSHPPPRGPRPR